MRSGTTGTSSRSRCTKTDQCGGDTQCARGPRLGRTGCIRLLQRLAQPNFPHICPVDRADCSCQRLNDIATSDGDCDRRIIESSARVYPAKELCYLLRFPGGEFSLNPAQLALWSLLAVVRVTDTQRVRRARPRGSLCRRARDAPRAEPSGRRHDLARRGDLLPPRVRTRRT